MNERFEARVAWAVEDVLGAQTRGELGRGLDAVVGELRDLGEKLFGNQVRVIFFMSRGLDRGMAKVYGRGTHSVQVYVPMSAGETCTLAAMNFEVAAEALLRLMRRELEDASPVAEVHSRDASKDG